jgi:hypothetical protein
VTALSPAELTVLRLAVADIKPGAAWADITDLADVMAPAVLQIAADRIRAAAQWLISDAPDVTSDGLSWGGDVEDTDIALVWIEDSLRDYADQLHTPREEDQ